MIQSRIGLICLAGGFLATQNAFCDSWTVPDEPLRFNIGVVQKESISPLSISQGRLINILPKIGEYNLPAVIKSQPGIMSATPAEHVKWHALDSEKIPQIFAFSLPFCTPPAGTKLTTRADAWEVAYSCLRGLASQDSATGTPLIMDFMDTGSTTLFGIEPVLDLVDPGQDRKEAERLERGRSIPIASATKPSPVWPSGSPGWHLDKDHSQLGVAYKSVFPQGIDTKGSVLVAHLDTGYFPEDPMRPVHFDPGLSKTCYKDRECTDGGVANWDAKGLFASPGHGTATLSNLAGRSYTLSNQTFTMGGNPSAHVFSINIHDTVIHLDSRRMAAGIEAAVNQKADLITLSHGGLPSLRLAKAVDLAYSSGTPIFAATGDFFEAPFFWFGRTFRSVVYPARYERVMGVAGVTMDGKSYGENPSVLWWFSFYPGYLSRMGSWMLRGNFGPTSVMDNGKVVVAYVPNITRSDADPKKYPFIGSNGAGTSHATPQVAAAASLWLEQNKPDLEKAGAWRSWEKSEAVYQALSQSASRCFPDYNIEHYGSGILKAGDALKWIYHPGTASVSGPSGKKTALEEKKPSGLDLPGVIELFLSARLPGKYQSALGDAFANALMTELSQLIFTSDTLQEYLQLFHICKLVDGCDRCNRQSLTDSEVFKLAKLVGKLPEASKTLKETFLSLATKAANK